MAFDGIVTKKIVDELQSIFEYKIDKIYEPDKNTVILSLLIRYLLQLNTLSIINLFKNNSTKKYYFLVFFTFFLSLQL